MSNRIASCIMVTRNRRAFAPLAIRCWQEQSYTPRELIIVSDGERIDDLIPAADERIVHVHLDRQISIGAKRNIGIGLSRGDFLAIWDDDDWHGPDRLLAQATALHRQWGRMCGSDQLNYGDVRTGEIWRYEYVPGRRTRHYLCGQTMMFERSLWLERRFEDGSRGEDNAFMAQRGEPFVNLDADQWYLALMHGGNTVYRTEEQRLASDQWRRLPLTLGDKAPLWWVDAVRQAVAP